MCVICCVLSVADGCLLVVVRCLLFVVIVWCFWCLSPVVYGLSLCCVVSVACCCRAVLAVMLPVAVVLVFVGCCSFRVVGCSSLFAVCCLLMGAC